MIRLLKEIENKPKYVIFENVASITSKKFKNTLDLFKEELKNLGYELYEDILNAADYGIPQTRKRYFLIAILNGCDSFSFPNPILTDIKILVKNIIYLATYANLMMEKYGLLIKIQIN